MKNNNKFKLGFDDGTSESYEVFVKWQSTKEAQIRGPEFYEQTLDYIKEVVSRTGHKLEQINSLTTMDHNPTTGTEEKKTNSVSWSKNIFGGYKGPGFDELFLNHISECFLPHTTQGYGENNKVDLTGVLSFDDTSFDDI